MSEATFTERQLTHARWIIYAAFIFNGFAMGSYIARIPDIRNHFGLTNSQLGLVTLAASLGILFSMKPAGAITAKFGSSRTLFHITWIYAISTSLVGLLLSVPYFIVTMFISGFLVAVHDISMNAHASTIEKVSGKSLMHGFHARFSLGGFAGAGLGGLCSQANVSFLVQSMLVGLIGIAMLPALSKFTLPTALDIHVDEEVAKDERERPHIFWWLGLLGFASSICEGAAADWGSILLRDTWAAAPFVATVPYILFSVAMVLGRFGGDRVTEKFSREFVIRVGGLTAGIGLTVGLLIGGTLGVSIGWILLGLGVSVAIPTLFSASAEIAAKRFAGHLAPAHAVAIVGGISYAGFLVGPPFLGLLSSLVTLRWALLVPAMFAIGMGLSARLVRD